MSFEIIIILVIFMVYGWGCFILGTRAVTKEKFFDNKKIEIHSAPEEIEEEFGEEEPIQL